MSRIRGLAAALGTDAFELQTVAKVGYRLVTLENSQAEVADVEASSEPVETSLNRRVIVGGLGAALDATAIIGWRRSGNVKMLFGTAELYRKSVEAQRQGLTEQNIQAVAYFRDAVTADPDNALA